MAGWVVAGNGTGAAVDAPSSGDRPVAATDDELLHLASERLIARCMARHGFAYAEQQPPSSTEPDFRYALDDVGWARKHGYAASTPRELRRLVAPASPESAGAQAQPQEIAAAVTEAECATSTRFSRTSGALERRYRPEIERRFARELGALKSFELTAIPRARRVLADA